MFCVIIWTIFYYQRFVYTEILQYCICLKGLNYRTVKQIYTILQIKRILLGLDINIRYFTFFIHFCQKLQLLGTLRYCFNFSSSFYAFHDENFVQKFSTSSVSSFVEWCFVQFRSIKVGINPVKFKCQITGRRYQVQNYFL